MDGFELIVRLVRGQAFGEQALANKQAPTRMLDVVADSDRLELLSLQKQQLEFVLKGKDIQEVFYKNYMHWAIEKTQFIKDIPEEVIELIKQKLKKKEYKAGRCLISSGETISTLFILVEGELKFTHKDLEKSMSLKKGKLFGESYLIPNQLLNTPIEGILRTVTDCVVYEISVEEFHKILHGTLENFLGLAGSKRLINSANIGKNSDIMVNLRLKSFTVLRNLGIGLIGSIYLAKYKDPYGMQRMVLLKIINLKDLDKIDGYKFCVVSSFE